MATVGAVVRRLGRGEWQLLRETRLHALADSPHAFGSTFDAEVGRDDEWWAASLERLAWFVAQEGHDTVGLVAGVRAGHDPACREVVSMWVAPARRGSRVAKDLVSSVVDWGRADGASTLGLRVSERNLRARRFYERVGFVATGDRRPLRSDPAISTLGMRLALPPARLRFAPSPAGELHVGHVRTAVLSWIVARQQRGTYFVRFENTDRAKERPGSRASIVADLAWLDLLGSEPPHEQSELTDRHQAALERLGAAGCTYRDGGAIRFRTPSDGSVDWDDLIRGPIQVANRDLDDPVLVRGSGWPTFYLASTVDDADDGITHVVRAEPMRRLTAKQMHIWACLGVEPPKVGHLPLVTRPQHRIVRFATGDGTVRSLREEGISPTAVLCYLAMPETASWKKPPSSLEELIDRIDLRRLPRRPTTFDLGALETLHRRLTATPNLGP